MATIPDHPQKVPSSRPAATGHSPGLFPEAFTSGHHRPPTRRQATHPPTGHPPADRPPTPTQATPPPAGHPPALRPPTRTQATHPPTGHPPGVALLYTTGGRATRGDDVYSRATPGGWPVGGWPVGGWPGAGGLLRARTGFR